MKWMIQKSTFKQAFKILFFLDNSTKVLSFLRNIVITTHYGLSMVTDAFNFAFNLVMTPINLISDALLAGVIPFLKEKKDEQEKVNFIYSVVILNLFISLAMLAIFVLGYDYFISLLAPGFSPAEIKLVFDFGLVLMISAQFMLIMKTFEGYFRANEIFGVTNIINFISALIGFIVLFLLAKKNYMFISYSYLIGILIGFFLFLLIAQKKVTAFDKSVFKLLSFSVPLILGGGIGVINSLVDKAFGTTLSQGALSALTYSFLIITVIGSTIIGPLMGSAYTFIVSLIIEKDIKTLALKIGKIKFIFLAIFFLFTVLMQYFGQWGLDLLFLRGQMTEEDVFLIFELLILYASINVFSGLTSLILQIFYSYKKVLLPSLISIFYICLNILLNFLFIEKYGVYALASSTVVISFMSTVTLAYFAKRMFSIIIIHSLDFIIILLMISSCLVLIISGMSLNLHLINIVIATLLIYSKFKNSR